ncbi:S41 family peptidase [Chitinophaga rhizophila]|uniref:S41 family peptidase n=1 Tax=Chitinophaga rhizophila TaxID=2866212 RepID=A0ABS7G5G4_9BACT|nr:S41 family peptidase [Chitinophaga rhizophila]MBW8682863.1 S41 family peptidase [Chitinophaga rhizophila]
MRKITLLAGLLLQFTMMANAQQPASPPLHPDGSLPERTFEVFWQTFEDHYAFFKLRKVDWKAAYAQYRPQVMSSTTDDSLFHILSRMVTPFQDDHINVIIPGKRQFRSDKPSQFLSEFPKGEMTGRFWSMVDESLASSGFGKLHTAGEKFRDIPLFSFARTKDVGYIRFRRSFSSAEEDDSNKDAVVAGKLLDSILNTFKDTRALIIDVRANIGGNDEFSYAMAGRFARKRVHGHYKQTRNGGYEDFGPREDWYIEPKGVAYHHPVMVLTNDQTASAADVFAMIMKTLPQVKLVGNHTLGIYSDMYGFELPNKWQVSLSNQRYYTSKGECYEGKGTPTDIQVLNTRKDLEEKSDPVLKRALAELSK